jgi:predicted TIM-barrel fold metal-dependent hydrolase
MEKINNKYIDKIFKIVSINENNTFIIAHVFEKFVGAKILLQYLKRRKLELPSNLYFELGGIMPNNDYVLGAYQVSLWREIGLDKILFGTDYLAPFSLIGTKEFLSSFRSHKILNEFEKRSILKNSRNFWVKKIKNL